MRTVNSLVRLVSILFCLTQNAVRTKHSREAKAAHLIKMARDQKADAVIILAAKFCEPALFDYALYRKALDDAKIPHLLLEFEEKMWIFDRARSEAETFVESLLFD